MKNHKNFKAAIIDGTVIIAIAFGLISCSNPSKPEDSKEVAEDQNEKTFDDKKSENDADFLVAAAEINLEEIQLGELAETNGTMADTKALGKMMKDEHTSKMNELKDLASKKMITIPTMLTEDGQDAYKKLSAKSGKDFDKEYTDMMVDGHKKAIDKFEKASSDANDADIKQWATSTLPALRTHLEHSITCQDKVKKM